MNDHGPDSEHQPHHHGDGPTDWDAQYVGEERVWSGNPNSLLVSETGELDAGSALDVGCGEGADAIWLASRGWRVTAVDVSTVAIERARAAGEAAGVEVDWRLCGLEEFPLPEQGFDLVTAFYPALLRADDRGLSRLLGAVAPGGILLFVRHADVDRERSLAHGFDRKDYLGSEHVAQALGADWTLEAHETRERDIRGGAGAHHKLDVILRARRAAS